MSGQIKRLVDFIVKERSKGDPLVADTTRVRLLLKGVDPARFTAESNDDPATLDRVRKAAIDFGIKLPKWI
jgi:hypothetical protein